MDQFSLSVIFKKKTHTGNVQTQAHAKASRGALIVHSELLIITYQILKCVAIKKEATIHLHTVF